MRVLFLLFVLVGCQVKKSESEPSFLYVVLSNHGEIKKTSEGYQLILDHGAVEKILSFSNRPYRIVERIHLDSFIELWTRGPDTFFQDPPNASVIIDQDVQTVVLKKIHSEGAKLFFTIQSDGSQPLREVSGKTQLFLDGGQMCTSTTCANKENQTGCNRHWYPCP